MIDEPTNIGQETPITAREGRLNSSTEDSLSSTVNTFRQHITIALCC